MPAANAQGLRESALDLLEDLESPAAGADPCHHAELAEGLLAQLQAAQAEPFMAEEMVRLQRAAEAARQQCDALAQQQSPPPRLEALLARCLWLGQARAYCEVRSECAEVSQQSARMAAFWQASLRVGCPP